MSMMPTESDECGQEGSERLLEILDDAITNYHRLTEWENGFCDDLRERVCYYGGRTRISPKQWAIVERIETKLYGL